MTKHAKSSVSKSNEKTQICISNPCTVKLYDGQCSKILNTCFPSLFLNKMVVIRTGTRKIFVWITNREDPDLQKQSDLGLHCLSRPFGQATSVQSFRTFIILCLSGWGTNAEIYCKFGKFHENFVFSNSIKRPICDVKNSWLGHELPISIKERVISQWFCFTKLCICAVSWI